MSVEEGGDPACWSELFERGEPTVVDLGTVDADGADGVAWTLTAEADLNANLVHLEPGSAIETHTNHELDVLLVVTEGEGRLTVEANPHNLTAGTLAHIPKGTSRRIEAGAGGLTYLSIHRRRGSLGLSPTNR